MLASVRQMLSHPATGLIAVAIAFALAVALGVSSTTWRAQRAGYETRIAELTHASERAEAGFRTELASCQAAGQARDALPAAKVAQGGATPEGARRLLEQQPEGFDACARMESADRAVLSNLKR